MPKLTRRETMSLGLGAGMGALLLPGLVRAAEDGPLPGTTFTIVHVNDIYRMGDEKGWGGFPKLAAVVRAERARGGPVVFTHGGDTFSPSLMSNFDHGAHIVRLTNMIRPDVFVPGNHEFDFGKRVFFERLSEAQFPVFAANMRDAQGNVLPQIHPSTIRDLGGVRVGFVGLAFERTPEVSQPGDLKFLSTIETLRSEADALRKAGADMVVGVAHADRAVDDAIIDQRIVDVLLTGHVHDLAIRYDGVSLHVESGEEGNYVTAIDFIVKVSESGGRRSVRWTPSFRIYDTPSVTPDPEVAEVVAGYESALSRALDVDIGRTAIELDSRTAVVRTREAAIGDLIADIMAKSVGAEIALLNGGGIRANTVYPAGTMLRRRDIQTELPFGNTMVLVKLKGRAVLAALEQGLSKLPEPSGRFPQVSGLEVVIDPARPVGSRVVSASAGGKPLDPDAVYSVASIDFLLSGGDGYTMLAEGTTVIGLTDGQRLANLVMDAIAAEGGVGAVAGGRIVRR